MLKERCIDDSRVTKLPDNLTIGTNDVFATLSVTGCPKLHQLPRGLKVTVIDCQASGIRVIPNDIKCDRINLDSAAYITELPLFKNYIETNVEDIYSSVTKEDKERIESQSIKERNQRLYIGISIFALAIGIVSIYSTRKK